MRQVLVLILIFSSLVGKSQHPSEQYWNKARQSYERGQLEQSIAYLDQAIALEPEQQSFYLKKASILTEMKKEKEAISVLRFFIDQYPQVLSPCFDLGNLYMDINIDSSIYFYSRIIGEGRYYDSMAYPNRARAFFLKGDLIRSAQDFDATFGYKHDQPVFFIYRSMTYTALKRFKDAIEDVNQAIRLRPGDWTYFTIRAANYAAAGELEKALTDYMFFHRKQPDNIGATFSIGKIHLQLKEYDKAVEYFDLCSKNRMQANELYFYRAVANYYLGRDEQVIADLEKVLKLYVPTGEVYFMLGMCHNNLVAGSGCDYLRKALKLDYQQASQTIMNECQ
jgi:tetratricopeptide (TPR) repeat protein